MSNALKADRARIAEIDAQVWDLQESIRLLQTQRKVLQDRLDAYRYPVLTLPNEITSEIFIRFLPPYPTCPPMKRGLSPFFLTHICHTWRNVALTTPTLWRAIRMVVRPVSPEKVDTQTDLVESWLSRSGSCLLSIQLDASPAWAPEVQLRYIQSLSAHCSRWQYVELAYLVPERFSFFSGATPLLRHLQLSMYDRPPSPIRLGGVPLLRSAVLGYNTSGSVTLPWQQLTSLTLDRVHPNESTRILQQAPNLLHCEIVLTAEDDSVQEGDVVLPSLHSLQLNALEIEEPINSATAYLRRFIAPALQRLEVVDEPDPIPPLASFISKSGCKLQELHISGLRDSVPQEKLYRNAFPSIPKISFESYYSHSQAELTDNW
ncbi:hypothetical protein C8R43DRAFT_186446 [Mycena crocata]|nr:hypothetical protein C8R43DRAFT_186446 [Mycena crocata]